MFEFMTVRELYEMVMSGEEFETESLEYVELDGWARSFILYNQQFITIFKLFPMQIT